jgi:hypothetical protein
MNLPSEHLRAETILEFRDRAFIEYFSRPEYLRMIGEKFGMQAVLDVKQMSAIRMQRQYWMEGAHPSHVASIV